MSSQALKNLSRLAAASVIALFSLVQERAVAAGTITGVPYTQVGIHPRSGFASLAEAASWACANSEPPLHGDWTIACDGSYVIHGNTGVFPPATGWSSFVTRYFYPNGQFAAGEPLGYYPDPPSSKNVCKEKQAGDPVGIGTGIMSCIPENDLPGGALPFVRNYSTARTPFKRDLGIGWSASYFQRLSIGQVGDWQLVVVRRPSGQEFSFDRTLPSTTWTTDADVDYRLLSDATSATYELRTPDDSVEIYDASGRLISITPKSGLGQSLTYDADSQLSDVTDSFGRSLHFTFFPDSALLGAGLLSSVTDSAGATTYYVYDVDNNLEKVIHPDTSIRQYHYNESAYTEESSPSNLMTGISDENGKRFGIFKYDATGRAYSTEQAGGAGKYTLDFQQPNLRTIVTDPLGASHTYNVSLIHGVIKVMNHNDPCPGCGGPRLTSTDYDTSGNASLITDFNGSQTSLVFDLSRNLEMQRIEAANCRSQGLSHRL
jgi:YD repeat-containing protein